MENNLLTLNLLFHYNSDLSRNDLQFIPKDIFRNLFFLKIM